RRSPDDGGPVMATPQPPGSQPQGIAAQAMPQGFSGNGQGQPLLLTTARWHNQKKASGKRDHDGHPVERWSKVLAHTGPLTQFTYGSDTPSEWGRSDLQTCMIAALHTGVIVIDGDDWARFAVTPLGRSLIARGLPVSHRGPDRCHYALDAR